MIRQDVIDLFRVPAGKKVRLKDYPTGWKQTEEFEELGKGAVKDRAGRRRSSPGARAIALPAASNARPR